MVEDFGADNLSPHGDAFYEALMKAHEELSPAASTALNARLILLMANHIGDIKSLQALLDIAKSYEEGL